MWLILKDTAVKDKTGQSTPYTQPLMAVFEWNYQGNIWLLFCHIFLLPYSTLHFCKKRKITHTASAIKYLWTNININEIHSKCDLIFLISFPRKLEVRFLFLNRYIYCHNYCPGTTYILLKQEQITCHVREHGL